MSQHFVPPPIARVLAACSLLLLALPSASSAQLASSAWPMFHRDPTHRGLSPSPSIHTPLARWAFQASDSIIESSPAIGPDGTIYFGAIDGRLYAVRPDGSLRWSFLAGGALRYSSPAIAEDGTIYVGAMDSTFYAVRPDGTLRWSVTRGNNFRSSPLILPNGDVVVGSSDFNMYRFTAAGDSVWRFPTLNFVRSSPAVGPRGDIYFGSWDTHIYAVSDSGSLRWAGTTGGIINLSSPTVGPDSMIYIGGRDKIVRAIRPDGSLRWTYSDSIPDNIDTTPAVRSDGIVVVGMGSHIDALYSATGQKLWRFQARHEVRSSPAVAIDRTVYFGSDDSTLYCVEPDGKLRWKFSPNSSIRTSPAIGADGTVYFGAENGRFYAIGAAVSGVAVPQQTAQFDLLPPTPGPATSSATLRFRVPEFTRARLEVFSVVGARVAVLWSGMGSLGERSIAWNLRDYRGTRVAAGVYRVRLTTGRSSVVRALVVLR